MKFSLKYCFVPIVLCLMVACQKDPAANATAQLVFRAEVAAGTAGAVAGENLEGSNSTVWFGEAHSFDVKYADARLGGSGKPVVSFELKGEEKEAFGDFTESLIGQRMAIEIDGKILSAPTISGRLPVGGEISGGGGGFTEQEVNDLVHFLRTGESGSG